MKQRVNKRYKLKSSVNENLYLLQMPDDVIVVEIIYIDTPSEEYNTLTSFPDCPSCKAPLAIEAESPYSHYSEALERQNWRRPTDFRVRTRWSQESTNADSCNINIEYFINGCLNFKNLTNITVESAKELIDDWS